MCRLKKKNVIILLIINFDKGIKITGHQSALPLGSLTTLNCTTDLDVDIIEWLDIKGTVLTNGTEQFLELTTETSKSEYTCRVSSTFGHQNKTVLLQVIPDLQSAPLVSSVVSAVIIVISLAIAFTLAIMVFVAIAR